MIVSSLVSALPSRVSRPSAPPEPLPWTSPMRSPRQTRPRGACNEAHRGGGTRRVRVHDVVLAVLAFVGQEVTHGRSSDHTRERRVF